MTVRKWIFIPLSGLVAALLVLFFSGVSRLAAVNYLLLFLMDSSAPHLSEWPDFKLSGSRFEIERLVFRLPGDTQTQRIDGLKGEFSLRDARLERLEVESASLFSPSSQAPAGGVEAPGQGLYLGELLSRLTLPPVASGQLAQLALDGRAEPLSLAWNRNPGENIATRWQGTFRELSLAAVITQLNDQHYTMQVEGAGNRFSLDIELDPAEGYWHLNLDLLSFNKESIVKFLPSVSVEWAKVTIDPRLSLHFLLPDSLGVFDVSGLNTKGHFSLGLSAESIPLDEPNNVLSKLSLEFEAVLEQRGRSILLTTDDIQLQAEHPAYWLPVLHLGSRLLIEPDHLGIEGRILSSRAQQLANYEGSYDIHGGKGRLNLSAPTTRIAPSGPAGTNTSAPALGGVSSPLSQWFESWPFPFDITEGDVQWQASLEWAPEEGLSDLVVLSSLNDVSGFADKMVFKGLQSEISIRRSDVGDWLLQSEKPLTLDTLDRGLLVHSIHSNLKANLSRGEYRGTEFNATLFGGQVEADTWLYSPGHFPNRNSIRFHSLDIEKLLAEAGYDGVEGTGLLEGELPLEIDAAGLSIENGVLKAREPGGVLRYIPSEEAKQTAAANPSLKLVNQALSNYHYQMLKANVDYAKNGDMLVKMRLEGKNPDMNGGQEINLNLNVSESVPALLKSLQASGVITEAIDNSLQR